MRQTKLFNGVELRQLSALEAIKVRYGVLKAIKSVDMASFQSKIKSTMSDQEIGSIFFDEFIELKVNGSHILDTANDIMRKSGVPVDTIPESDFIPFLIVCLKLSWPDFFSKMKLPAARVGTE